MLPSAGGTRTCIHTPGASYLPENLTPNTINQALDGAQLVYFDGRLTETAVLLARAARQSGVPVLVEAERLRPNLEVLLREADYICTSAHFPQVCQRNIFIFMVSCVVVLLVHEEKKKGKDCAVTSWTRASAQTQSHFEIAKLAHSPGLITIILRHKITQGLDTGSILLLLLHDCSKGFDFLHS